jgi:hypothetical protein
LGCEQLSDRINPTTVGDFTGTAYGTFTYDETQVNPSLSTRTLTLSDLEFNFTALHYVADSDPVAHLAYGQFVSLDSFTASCDSDPQQPDVTISVAGSVVTYTVNGQSSQGTGEVDLDPQGTVTVNFSTFTNGGGVADADNITITVSRGGQFYMVKVPIAQGKTPANTALQVQQALIAKGLTDAKFNGTYVTIKGLQPGDSFDFEHDEGSQNGEPIITEVGF